MKRVYLDQWVWIGLGRAAHNRPDAKRYTDALRAVEEGANAGVASFPLSSVHYLETLKETDPARRQRLGVVMGVLSRFHTIASPDLVVTMEVDRAVGDVFDLSVDPRDIEIFGFGFCHACGADTEFQIPGSLPPEQREVIRLQVELGCLIGIPAWEPAWGSLRSLLSFGAPFARDETGLAGALEKAGIPPRRQASEVHHRRLACRDH